MDIGKWTREVGWGMGVGRASYVRERDAYCHDMNMNHLCWMNK